MPERCARRVEMPSPIALIGDGGLTLRGDAWGEASAPPVILLHGGGQTRHAWGDTSKRLADAGFYALALDLRGHGDSDWAPDGDYSMERFVGDLLCAARLFSVRPALVGASMGGITSLLAQGEHPELGRALVLVDIATSAQPEGLKRIYDFMTQKPEGFATLDEVADAIAAYQPQRKRPKNLSGLAKNVRKGADGRYRWHWDPTFMRPSGPNDHPMRKDRLERAARALRVPTLLVRGRQSDVISEDDVREFLSYVPHAESIDVRDAGHMVAGDVNDVFSDAVIEFLKRTR